MRGAVEEAAGFIEARRESCRQVYEGLKDLQEFLVLPEVTLGSEPSWFGFPIAVGENAPFTRHDLTRRLEETRIGNHLLFGGNLTREPAFKDPPFRVGGDLRNSDFAMNQLFWIGVDPGLGALKLSHTIDVIRETDADSWKSPKPLVTQSNA